MEKFKVFGFVAATAVVGASALITTPRASAQEVTMRLHTFVPAVSRSFKNVTWWAKQVEKKSGGRIKIKLFPSRQLGGKPSELYDQARRGFVDMIYSLPGYSPGRFPRSEVIELPFVSGKSPRIISPAIQSIYDWSTATPRPERLHYAFSVPTSPEKMEIKSTFPVSNTKPHDRGREPHG